MTLAECVLYLSVGQTNTTPARRFDFMATFQEIGLLAGKIDILMDSNTNEDFLSYQHFLFGCCNWLQSFIEFPKVRDAYEKCKLGLGSRSMFTNTIGYREMDVFRGKRKTCQYLLYMLFRELLTATDIGYLGAMTRRLITPLLDFVSVTHIEGIWKDTVVQKPLYQKHYPIEVRRMGDEIRKADKYSEIGVLGDMCEDFNLPEEADHFHDATCLHTYGCRYLFNTCRGMDGRATT